MRDQSRSMAQKESQHREVVDDLTSQLTQVRRQHEELMTLNRDQVCALNRVKCSIAHIDLDVEHGQGDRGPPA
jgi:hypothetical protein